jgi:hypothetical protein
LFLARSGRHGNRYVGARRPELINHWLRIAVLGAAVLSAQDRPGLFFREDWKEIPAETPVTQQHAANPSLSLALYGPGKAGIRKSYHDKPADDPYYIWSGECKGNWALTLRECGVDESPPGWVRQRIFDSPVRYHQASPVYLEARRRLLVD